MASLPLDARTLAALQAVLASDERVRLALVFGSVARGQTHATSDLDVAVQGRNLDLDRLAADLSQVSDGEVDVVSLDQVGIPLLEEIVRDGVVIYEAGAGTAAIWRSRALGRLELDRPWYARMRDAWLRRVAEEGMSRG
ncbi:MAG TPA: nucleotidyltransferase domain-containing protein [Polyangiaceae bacterium]|nr:nucleotidyltransferase domain-containing protein [Polyangiaceae bacterium]